MSLLPDWLTGYDAQNADAAAAADAQLQQMNATDYAPGGNIYDTIAANDGTAAADAAQAAQKKNAASAAPSGQAAQRTQIDQAFTSTLDSQAQAIVGGPLAVFWATVKSILKAIPWWLWLVILLVPFGYLGGFGWLSRNAKKQFSK